MPDTRLIERWLPITAIGEESIRERRSMTALPPIYYLHGVVGAPAVGGLTGGESLHRCCLRTLTDRDSCMCWASTVTRSR